MIKQNEGIKERKMVIATHFEGGRRQGKNNERNKYFSFPKKKKKQ